MTLVLTLAYAFLIAYCIVRLSRIFLFQRTRQSFLKRVNQQHLPKGLARKSHLIGFFHPYWSLSLFIYLNFIFHFHSRLVTLGVEANAFYGQLCVPYKWLFHTFIVSSTPVIWMLIPLRFYRELSSASGSSFRHLSTLSICINGIGLRPAGTLGVLSFFSWLNV